MELTFENKPTLGFGIYTVPDVAQILRLPYGKVNRWIKSYWDNKFGQEFNERYSWTDGKSIAVSFHTLIEVCTFYQLTDAGVRSKEIINAHDILSKEFDTHFPFAQSVVLENLSTDGKKIFFNTESKNIVNVDMTNQLNLGFINNFFKKIDFNDTKLAQRLWPIGKEKSVVVDPEHQFGLPVIDGTNIQVETIFNLFKANESKSFIASIYELSEEQVDHAIQYCEAAA